MDSKRDVQKPISSMNVQAAENPETYGARPQQMRPPAIKRVIDTSSAGLVKRKV